MLYIINNKIYKILCNKIIYNDIVLLTLSYNIIGLTHNRYLCFILTESCVYVTDHTCSFIKKEYTLDESVRELAHIGCNSRDLYYSTKRQLYSIPIPAIFSTVLYKPTKVFESSTDILSVYVGEYYRAVQTLDNVYVAGMNNFMQFGPHMFQREYASFIPLGALGSTHFTPKAVAYFTQQSIQLYGKYSQTVHCNHIISNIAIIDNILLYAAANVSHIIQYSLYLFNLNTQQYIQEAISLSEETFLIGIHSLHIFDSNITVVLQDDTVIQLQAAAGQAGQAGQQAAAGQAGQQAGRLISAGSTAYHTIYNTATGLIQTGRCFKQGPTIIQNTQLIKKIITNTTHTLFIFHNGVVYIMTNMDGSIESLAFNEPIIDAALGRQHMIFVGISGTVYCTGDNSFGQLGIGTYSPATDTIITLPRSSFEQKAEAIFASLGITKEPLGPDAFVIERVYAGIDTSFFVARDGSIYCCGNNSYGQLGIGTKNTRNVPVRMTRFCSVIALSGETVIDIQCTVNATVFLLSSGRIMTAGQLPGDLSACNLFPCLLPAAQPVCQISTGINHYVLRFTDNSTISSNNVGKSGICHIICGAYHTIYLRTDGTVETDGQNGYGQLNITEHIL